jgi:hypothetical protein
MRPGSAHQERVDFSLRRRIDWTSAADRVSVHEETGKSLAPR